MARPVEQDGAVYRRQDSTFWWMRYRDRQGILRKESTGVNDWQAAQKSSGSGCMLGTETSSILSGGVKLSTLGNGRISSWTTTQNRQYAN